MMPRISAAHASAPAPVISVTPSGRLIWMFTACRACMSLIIAPPRPMMRPSSSRALDHHGRPGAPVAAVAVSAGSRSREPQARARALLRVVPGKVALGFGRLLGTRRGLRGVLRHGLVRDGARLGHDGGEVPARRGPRRTPGPPFQPGRSAFPRGRRSRARGRGRARGPGGGGDFGRGRRFRGLFHGGGLREDEREWEREWGTAVSDPRVRRLGFARSDDRVIGGKNAGASSSGRRGGSGGGSVARVAAGRAARRARRRPLGRTREKLARPRASRTSGSAGAAAVVSSPVASASSAFCRRSTSTALRPSVSRLRFLSSLRSTATVIELGLVMTRVCLSRAGARRRVRGGLTSRAHFFASGSRCRVCGILLAARRETRAPGG